jgi:hypothetical protein
MSDGALTWREWVWEWGEVPMTLTLPFCLVTMIISDTTGVFWPQNLMFFLMLPPLALWVASVRLGAKYPRHRDLPEWRVRRRLAGIYGGKPC